MSNNQNILFLFIAITTLAITWMALKVPAVEGQVIFDDSSQRLIVDPYGPDQVSRPPGLLAPDPTTVLTNEQVTLPYGPDQVSRPPGLLAPDPTTVLTNEQVTLPLVKPGFSQPTYATNATATTSLLSSHIEGRICVYANISYSPGSTIVMGNDLKTCQSDGSWTLGRQ